MITPMLTRPETVPVKSGGANAEIVHQFGGHNGRCHALVKSEQIQEGTQSPG